MGFITAERRQMLNRRLDSAVKIVYVYIHEVETDPG
jgi:hypothetical protein